MSGSTHPYKELGELITQLIETLVAVKRWSKTRAMAEVARRTGYSTAAVYRWRQGHLRPPDEALEVLVQIAYEIGMDRTWAEKFLRAARYPAVESLLNTYWGPKELRHIPNNLPPLGHTLFVGRKAEMARLLELLSPHHAAHLITIDGIGGVGKTALILEVAYRCLRASTGEMPHPRIPTFDAIIFVSAKQQILTPKGILRRRQAQRTLRDIFHAISSTLERPDIRQVGPEQQIVRARHALGRQRTLLIVDNLETVADREDILAFLYDLPPSVKVVITTREQALFSPIRLEHLPKEESIRLILHEAKEMGVSVTQEDALALYERTGGIPAAMIYAVGQIAGGSSVEAVLTRISQATGDVARFCFEGLISPLRGKPAHRLFMAVAMFPKRPLREAVIYVAGLATDPLAADEGLARLQQISLITQREGRYSMLPLTREYALAELAAHPEFDEEEWENLSAVLDWCAAHDRYEDIRDLWFGAYLGGFTNLYGYWDDRLSWLEWLMQSAERRGEWHIVAQTLLDLSWTRILRGEGEQAESMLGQAWQLREHLPPERQTEIANDFAILAIRRGQYSAAFEWLDESEVILGKAKIPDRERMRFWIPIPYYRGEAYYYTGDYEEAKVQFRRVAEESEAIGWRRAVIYAQNWLADIAIAEGDLDTAERLLRTGLPVAERNKDRRRIAFYKRSFAHLEQKRGNIEAARRWAKQALEDFERLSMHPQIEEMQELMRLLGN